MDSQKLFKVWNKIGVRKKRVNGAIAPGLVSPTLGTAIQGTVEGVITGVGSKLGELLEDSLTRDPDSAC